jgi:uncharacterized protein
VARRPARSVPTVIVPGWQDSGEGHWQTWLEDQLRAAGRTTLRPPFPDFENPELGEWLTALRAAIAELPADGFDVVAHSIGAVLWLHHAISPGDSPRPARVALVAPPSPTTAIPEIASFFPPPLDVEAVRRAADGTVLIAGEDDPYLPEGVGTAYALPLRIATTVVPGGGHLNVDSGYGEWPAMLAWCNRDHLAFF